MIEKSSHLEEKSKDNENDTFNSAQKTAGRKSLKRNTAPASAKNDGRTAGRL